jgi:hypothetical protein
MRALLDFADLNATSHRHPFNPLCVAVQDASTGSRRGFRLFDRPREILQVTSH